MSDSRFHLKVEFTIYGKKFDWDASLNYFDNGDGMDDRIRDWFVKCYQEAYEEYQERLLRAERRDEQKNLEKREREELARLKAKYEGERGGE